MTTYKIRLLLIFLNVTIIAIPQILAQEREITVTNHNYAKEDKKASSKEVNGAITFDNQTHLAKKTLPFDQLVLLQIPIHKLKNGSNEKHQYVSIYEATSKDYNSESISYKNLRKYKGSSTWYTVRNSESFIIPIVPKPFRYYYIVTSHDSVSIKKGIPNMIDSIKFPNFSHPIRDPENDKYKVYLAHSFDSGIENNIKHYFSSDIGMIVIPRFKNKPVAPFIGINMYLRPFNRNLLHRRIKHRDNPLYSDTCSVERHFIGRKFGLQIGLTLTSLSEENIRDDIMGNFNLMTGITYRITQMIGCSAGALWYTRLDENPMIDHKTTTATLYFSLSIDLNLKKVAGDFTDQIF